MQKTKAEKMMKKKDKKCSKGEKVGPLLCKKFQFNEDECKAIVPAFV